MRRKMILGLACAVLATTVAAQQETTRLRTVTGSLSNSYMGTSVANAGDVNRDGFDDLIFGAPFHDGPNGVDSGVVFVYDGRTGQILHNLDGPFAGRRYGTSVAGAGDVNGDGYDDVIVGGYGSGSGVVRVISGLTGGTLVTLTDAAGWGLGHSVSGAGDVDGDGKADVVVGLPYYDNGGSNVGAVRIYSLAPSFSQVASFTGTHPSQYLGWSVGCAGDVDGDGRSDVVAGAPFYNLGLPNGNIGRVEVFSPWQGTNSAPLVDFIPNIGTSGNHANAGYSVTGIGDVNGDGVPDVACGAPSYERNGSNITNGRVYAISGVQVSGQSATVLWVAEAATSSAERLGNRICALGDPCGDLPLDVVAASPDFLSGGDDLGKISILSATTGGLRDVHYGYVDGEGFGDGLDAGGDHDGDGDADYVVGAPAFDNIQSFIGTVNSGRIYVFSGDSEVRDHKTAAGFQVDPGHRVAVIGDTDGDGFDEYVIGQPDPGTGTDDGRATVYDGKTGATKFSVNQSALAPNEFGYDVSGAGDVDGDGVPDFIVGAPMTSPRGAAFVYSGVDGTPLGSMFGGIGGSRFGSSVSGNVDVNGDGNVDLLVGDPFHAGGFGRVTVYSGATFGVLALVNGVTTGGRLGSDVAGLGDLDGDGFGDVAIGVEGEPVGGPGDDSGQLRVYVGSPGGLFLAVSVNGNPGERCGASVAAAGDVNGDGTVDVVVGGPGYSSMPLLGPQILERGRVRVVDPLTGSVIQTRLGLTAGDMLGYSVDGAGDVNGDGLADYVAGAPFADLQGRTDVGYAQVWSGGTDGLLLQIEGSNSINSLGNGGAQMGRSVAGGARITADCLSDVLVCSSHNYTPGTGFKTLVYGLGDFPGLDHYGTGTPSCDGPVCLTGNGPPTVGNDAFALRCLGAEGMSTGDLLLTTTGFQSPAGLDPTGLGILLHVDWLTAPILGIVSFTCNAAGFAAFPAQIPAIPGLAGFVLSFQAILYTQSACAGPVFGYSTTNGLDMIIQP